jgi:hypothetical protein
MNKKIPMTEVDKFLFIHPQPQIWVSFYSSTISCIGLISFIHNLLNRSLLIHPQIPVYVSLWMNENRSIPEVVDEKRNLHQRLWMNKKRPIPEAVNE